MRILILVLGILMLVGYLGFVMMNLDARVAVTLPGTEYPDVGLNLVVFLSVSAGILFAGIIGVVEGLRMRVANRQLLREVQRLETELNYLRTQPSTRPAPTEPLDASHDSEIAPASKAGLALPSAPVYGADDEDDDYSGGRAV